MKQFISFTKKEFIHISRDSRTILILLVMPAVLIAIFGFIITTEVRGAKVIVCDECVTQDSRRVKEAIDANEYFILVNTCDDIGDAQTRLHIGEADVAVCIDADGKILVLCDGSEPNQAQIRGVYLQQIIQSVLAENVALPRLPLQIRYLFNPQQKSEYNFVPGVIGLIIMLICVMMTSIAIVREKEQGTMELLLASPLSPITIISSKLIPYLVVSSLNLFSILLLSYYLLGIPLAGSIFAFIMITMLYTLVALALGLLISTAVSTQMAALLLSLLMIVPTIYLSDFVFPVDSLPIVMQKISNIFPATWYIDAARRIMIEGTETKYVAKDFVILAIMAIVLMGFSVKLFKKRLS